MQNIFAVHSGEAGAKVIPSPYMWTPQPQRGTAAGAAQDYSTRMNWMSAGPGLINRVNQIREARNQILQNEALATETPRAVLNPPVWPAGAIYGADKIAPPIHLTLPRNESLEEAMVDDGAQIAGGALLDFAPGVYRYRHNPRRALLRNTPYSPPTEGGVYAARPGIRGGALVLAEHIAPDREQRQQRIALRSDGSFQLGGSGVPRYSRPQLQEITLSSRSSVPRSGGIGLNQFVNEFVPTVYLNPFSGPPGTFPDQFQPNYDIVTETVSGYD